jgi:hypothetical protein
MPSLYGGEKLKVFGYERRVKSSKFPPGARAATHAWKYSTSQLLTRQTSGAACLAAMPPPWFINWF